jgi:hypothetical protein
MPDAKEAYEMVTKHKPPEPGALERQQRRQVRAARNKKIGAFVVAAAIGVIAVALVFAMRLDRDPTTPADTPTTTAPADPEALGVAMNFLAAYDAHDAEGVRSTMNDSALSALPLGQLKLRLSWDEATGHTETNNSCEEVGSSAAGTDFHCTFVFSALRSDEIGLGPYGGSYRELTVRDGEIVRYSDYLEIDKFSPQVWEPFARWVSKAYPHDAAIMYTDNSLSDFRLTPESVQLWKQHTRDYVKHVLSG